MIHSTFRTKLAEHFTHQMNHFPIFLTTITKVKTKTIYQSIVE